MRRLNQEFFNRNSGFSRQQQPVKKPRAGFCKSLNPPQSGADVRISSFSRFEKASENPPPQRSFVGVNSRQTEGLSGYIEHFISGERWVHLTPAGLPFPVSGIIVEIDGAMQHAPHWLHFIFLPARLSNEFSY
jgi:hypothetical protein